MTKRGGGRKEDKNLKREEKRGWAFFSVDDEKSARQRTKNKCKKCIQNCSHTCPRLTDWGRTTTRTCRPRCSRMQKSAGDKTAKRKRFEGGGERKAVFLRFRLHKTKKNMRRERGGKKRVFNVYILTSGHEKVLFFIIIFWICPPQLSPIQKVSRPKPHPKKTPEYEQLHTHTPRFVPCSRQCCQMVTKKGNKAGFECNKIY